MAVGTFDGVHLGHREVIAGSDTVLTFDPHPVSVVAPQHTPKLLTTPARKAELIASLGVARAGRDPVRRRLRPALGGGVRRRRARRRARRHAAWRSARTSASGTRRRATRACCRPTGASRRPCTRCSRSTARSSPPATSAGSCWRASVAEANRLLGARFQLCGEVAHGDERGRELGFPTANLVPDDDFACPGHGVYACLATSRRRRSARRGRCRGGGLDRRAPDLPDRPRRADRGLPARLRRRPLRASRCASTSSRACAASAASTRPRRSSSRCTATSRRRASSPPASGRAERVAAIEHRSGTTRLLPCLGP